jgi:beta-N-acetylhexosaminidase
MNLGQLFLVGFDGCTLARSPWLRAALNQDQVGGVILFDRNVDGSVQNFSSPAALRCLTAELRHEAAGHLLIAVDQEGGKVRRLKERDGFPATRSAADLGKEELPACSTSHAAAAMAKTLAEHGINFNLAPVADLNLNPASPIIARWERSFGSSAAQVAAHCRAFIAAHHCCGIACCLKHFPGHGSARGDTHLGFVDISRDWQAIELEPYRILIDAGCVDAIMTAHVTHRGLESSNNLPASLSPAVLTGLLREKLGFNGLIISDDLQMKAITAQYGYQEAVRRAVLAGTDLLIVGNNLLRCPDALAQGIAAVAELLAQGVLDEERIRASLARIAHLKKQINGEQSW